MSPDSKGASQPVPKLVPAEILVKIARIVGPHGVVAEAAEIEPFLTDERGVFTGRTAMMVRPGSTQEVAEILRLCNEARVPIVPQGGNTSSVGAATPHGDGGEILLSMTRMNRILGIDPLNNAITLEAGVILADVQKAAEEADRLFPLSLGGEGTARIGGNLSTNAGGTGVLRYGNTRDLTMGIEAVLADGRVWDGMTALRKDNTGYDLKQLFIGAEGTLGVITACVMKLFPRPRDVETAFAAVPGPGEAVELLALARTLSGEVVSSFEWMARRPLGFVLDHIEGTRDPLPKPHDHYVLIEFASTDASDKMRAILEAVLAAGLEKGLVLDAAIAETAAHARDFWRLRETMPEGQKPEGASIKHDISVPVSAIAEFIAQATAAVEAELLGIRICAFGHVGDGNVHYNLSQPVDSDAASFRALQPALNRIVHDIAVSLGGSISAEHGIGMLRREEFRHYASPVTLDLMRAIKATLDPNNIMNPGKVL